LIATPEPTGLAQPPAPLDINGQLEDKQGVLEGAGFRREIRDGGKGLASQVNSFDLNYANEQFAAANDIRKQSIADRDGVPVELAYASSRVKDLYRLNLAQSLGDGTHNRFASTGADGAAVTNAQTNVSKQLNKRILDSVQNIPEGTTQRRDADDALKLWTSGGDQTEAGFAAAEAAVTMMKETGMFKNFFGGELPPGLNMRDIIKAELGDPGAWFEGDNIIFTLADDRRINIDTSGDNRAAAVLLAKYVSNLDTTNLEDS